MERKKNHARKKPQASQKLCFTKHHLPNTAHALQEGKNDKADANLAFVWSSTLNI